jgi:hypothetical protein
MGPAVTAKPEREKRTPALAGVSSRSLMGWLSYPDFGAAITSLHGTLGLNKS